MCRSHKRWSMTTRRRIRIIVSAVLGAAAAVAGFYAFPKLTQPIRTNLIGPEHRTVNLVASDGRAVEVAYELTALAQTRSVFGVESPYLERSETLAKVTDPQALPTDLDVADFNDAITADIRARTAGKWKMEPLEMPQFTAGEPITVASAETSDWKLNGILWNHGRLTLLGLIVATVSYAVVTILLHLVRGAAQKNKAPGLA